MRREVVLVTGAGGEIGHALVTRLASEDVSLITVDVNPLDPALARHVTREFRGSVTDTALLERMMSEFAVDRIFHLAALLSTRSEFTPLAAHQVNVEGTLNLLEYAQREGESNGQPVRFVYPSSIAAYGVPDLETKRRAAPAREDEFAHPTTMYGCNKLYCEELGRYYAGHYKQLSVGVTPRVDFRALRFPGLMSAVTTPSGGTSDYAPEMIHAAARGASYACFVRPDTTIPFMAMPDACEALVSLSVAPRARLTRTTYNVTAFSASAEEIRSDVLRAYPHADISFRVDERRQAIVDSWPSALDDGPARADWGFRPLYDRARAFGDYLIPTIGRHYTS